MAKIAKKKRRASPNPLAPKKTGAVAVVDAFQEDAGAGQETMSADDYAIPRITILQALSPQLQKNKSEFLDDADVGDICDTVSAQLWSGEEGIVVLPISYRRAYIEWKTREDGGGFVADHGSDGAILDGCSKNEKGMDMTKDGHQIVTTAEYFAFVINAETGAFHPVVISMSSTQLKKARRWNTMMNQFQMKNKDGKSFNPPMFSRLYHFTTAVESNDRGTWFGWNIKPGEIISTISGGMEIYNEAKNFRTRVMSGEIKASQPVDATPKEDDDSPM